MVNHTLTAPVSTKKANPHSATSYRSVQITCRQLITAPNPLFSWLDKMDNPDEAGSDLRTLNPAYRELKDLVSDWHSVKEEREIKAFFPFEVQIMDSDAYSDTVSGTAAHVRYKMSQIRTARRRVLGEIL
jgi:uncharacterized protein (TIGR04562 family)